MTVGALSGVCCCAWLTAVGYAVLKRLGENAISATVFFTGLKDADKDKEELH